MDKILKNVLTKNNSNNKIGYHSVGTMKLLNCLDCHDVFAMGLNKIICVCGKSEGNYLSNGKDVLVSGNCRILGMRNDQYISSIQDNNPHKDYNWFVITGTNRESHIALACG